MKKSIHLSVVLAAMIAPLVLAGCSPDKPPATSTPEAQKSMMEGMKTYDKKSDKTAEKPAEIGYFGAYVIRDRFIEFGQQRQLLLYWQ